MTNVSQERLNEDQINQVADIVNELHRSRVLSDGDHSLIENLIVSHLAVNAERDRYKAALEWAGRIIDSGMGAGILRYDPIKWFIETHEMRNGGSSK